MIILVMHLVIVLYVFHIFIFIACILVLLHIELHAFDSVLACPNVLCVKKI